jgi:hypothetical protein
MIEPFLKELWPFDFEKFQFKVFVSSPELKAQVSYSDHPLSVVRPSVCKLLHF